MARRYAPEFRMRVIERVGSGHSVSAVAKELGLSEASVYRWITQEAIDRGERAGICSSEHIELQRARSRIRELETELAVIKRASELFSGGEHRPKASSR